MCRLECGLGWSSGSNVLDGGLKSSMSRSTVGGHSCACVDLRMLSILNIIRYVAAAMRPFALSFAAAHCAVSERLNMTFLQILAGQ